MHDLGPRTAGATPFWSRWLPWLWLAVGLALTAVSNGRHILPVAAWLAPIFLLGFSRTTSPWGLVVGLVAYAATHLVMYDSVIPLKGVPFVLVTVGIAALGALPYLVDRATSRHLPPLVSTLVFPLGWTAVEYASALANPYGTWASAAYTQSSQSPLVQLASITGLGGITFLVTWMAPMALYALWAARDRSRPWCPVAVYALVSALVLGYGGARLWFEPAPTVRVAGIARPQGEPEDEGGYYLEQSARAASAGARIVVWPECAVSLASGDEGDYLAACSEVARGQRVYLAASVAVTGKFPGGLYENKIVFIGPDGSIIDEYVKARPVPGEQCVPGPGAIPVYPTPYGRIALAICFDLDFPGLMRQVGASQADLLIAPSSDWRAIDPLHTNMAVFRSVENGCALFRVAGVGRSVATDPRGAIIAQSDSFASDDALIASIPMGGVRTVYSAVGDAFAILCVSLLGVLLVFARVRASKGASQ